MMKCHLDYRLPLCILETRIKLVSRPFSQVILNHLSPQLIKGEEGLTKNLIQCFTTPTIDAFGAIRKPISTLILKRLENSVKKSKKIDSSEEQ